MLPSRYFSSGLLVLSLGCTAEHRYAEMQKEIARRDLLPHLVIQIYAPANPEGRKLTCEEVGRTRYSSHLTSGILRPAGTASDSIPVFETHADPLGETESLIFSFFGTPHCYVFKPPASVSSEGWTNWQSPAYEVNEQGHHAAFKLINNGKVVQIQSGPLAPKVRYRLMNLNVYYSKTANSRTEESGRPIPPP